MKTSPRIITWSAVSSKRQAEDDKYSIDDQRRMGREVVEKFNGTLIDELIVPGFSRDYRTLAEVITATDDNEVDAFRRLAAHIRRRSFDLFVCLDADRFGRKASLVLEIIDIVTRDCDAEIYTMFDNFTMDGTTGLTVGLMKAYKSQMDMERLKEGRKKGLVKRTQQGKANSSSMPLFHRRIRDDSGKEIAIVVNEDMRNLWTDLATVILRGVGWRRVETVLFNEFGHGKNGQPYLPETMRAYVLNPNFWGHSALYYYKKNNVSHISVGPWMWDETVSPPSPIIIYHNLKPAVYGGEWAELGERIKAELWRRHGIKGKGTSENTFRFHGLLVCDQCGYTLARVRTNVNGYEYLRCETVWRQRADRNARCTMTKHIRAEVVQAYFHEQLQAYINNASVDFFDTKSNIATLENRIEAEQQNIKRLHVRLETMITELTDAPEAARDIYRRRIAEVSEEIERSKGNVQAWNRETMADAELKKAQERIAAELKENGADWLWTQSGTVIHQFLAVALGNRQVVVRDGEIVGTTPITRRGFKAVRKKFFIV